MGWGLGFLVGFWGVVFLWFLFVCFGVGFFCFTLVHEGWSSFAVWCSALRSAMECILTSSWQVLLKDHKASEQN